MQWLGGECGLPYETDFLITHIPPKGVLDEGMGSKILQRTILKLQPKHHLFGHVHSIINLLSNFLVYCRIKP